LGLKSAGDKSLVAPSLVPYAASLNGRVRREAIWPSVNGQFIVRSDLPDAQVSAAPRRFLIFQYAVII
jgi:hypothetical protein